RPGPGTLRSERVPGRSGGSSRSARAGNTGGPVLDAGQGRCADLAAVRNPRSVRRASLREMAGTAAPPRHSRRTRQDGTPPSVGEPIRDRTTDAQALRLRTQTRTSCEGMISMALDRNLNAAVDAAWQQISAERIAELVVGLINIPSPTGEEADLAVWAADDLNAHGV